MSLEYLFRQDTEGMVWIVERLQKLAQNWHAAQLRRMDLCLISESGKNARCRKKPALRRKLSKFLCCLLTSERSSWSIFVQRLVIQQQLVAHAQF